MSPAETARLMTAARKRFGVDRMAVSGGESTLNRRWLLEYVRELKLLNQEVELMGDRLCAVGPAIQVCLLDYRPEFMRPDLVQPKSAEMVEIRRRLLARGLKTVICQTEYGHIGPG